VRPSILDKQGLIRAPGGAGPSDRLARVQAWNSLQDPVPDRVPAGSPPALVCSSGRFEDGPGGPGALRTWGPEGWRRLEAFCDGLEPLLGRAGVVLVLRPHARDVLSDAQSCLTFLTRREGRPSRLLLDPAGMLTPGMLGDAPDHLGRMMDALGGHPGVWGLLLTNVRPDGAGGLEPCPLHLGEVDAGLLAGLAGGWGDGGPVVVLEEGFEAQIELLGRARGEAGP
jgi:hypothetical protein